MSNIDDARRQIQGIGAAINGESAAMQTLGNVGFDPHPERLLAVGLAHSQNALAALLKEVVDLRTEVDALRARRR